MPDFTACGPIPKVRITPVDTAIHFGSDTFAMNFKSAFFTVTILGISAAVNGASVPKWERFEQTLESSANYSNPAQEAKLTATFTSPSGEKFTVPGFWDGGKTWRVRFSPNKEGKWTFTTVCSDAANKGL